MYIEKTGGIMKKIIVLFVMLLLIAYCSKKGASTPNDAVQAMYNAVIKSDGGALYDTLSKESADNMEKMFKGMFQFVLQMSKQSGQQNEQTKMMEELNNVNGRDFFVKLFAQPDVSKSMKDKTGEKFEIVDTKIDGDKAVVKTKTGDKEEDIEVVKENGVWKIKFDLKEKEN